MKSRNKSKQREGSESKGGKNQIKRNGGTVYPLPSSWCLADLHLGKEQCEDKKGGRVAETRREATRTGRKIWKTKQNNKSGLKEEGAKKKPGSWGGAYGKRQIKPGTGGRM